MRPDVLSPEMVVFRLRLTPQRPIRVTLVVTAQAPGHEGPRLLAVGDALRRLREEDEESPPQHGPDKQSAKAPSAAFGSHGICTCA